jgi:1-acyl-sn-glycerol-3-phosphate acyltransferase
MLRHVFFLTVVRPLVFVFLGVNIRNRQLLPSTGPALVVANHNSHLDTLVLMALFPLRHLKSVRPVAAADYWLKNRWIGWFANHIMRIVPVERVRDKNAPAADPLKNISQALTDGSILIFFPEGSRGEAEKLTRFRSGIARLVERHPDVPVVPVFLHGLGKSLPRGEGVLIPFICDVFVGEPMRWQENQTDFLPKLEERVEDLAKQARMTNWE